MAHGRRSHAGVQCYLRPCRCGGQSSVEFRRIPRLRLPQGGFGTMVQQRLRHLRRLMEESRVERVSAGVYMTPRKTKYGLASAHPEKVVRAFLGEDNFLMVSPNVFNGLGVGTTQLYNETVVYNRKRHGRFTLAGRAYDFRRRLSVLACFRHNSTVGKPASCSLIIPIICASVKRLFLMSSAPSG